MTSTSTPQQQSSYDPQPPQGYWQIERTENPQPISPFAASLVLPAYTDSTRRVFADVGLLIEAAVWREIGGWVYLGTLPLGPDADLEVRIQRCLEARETLGAEYMDRWEEEWRPDLLSRIATLESLDLDRLNDRDLADRLDETVAFFRDASDIHFYLHGTNALVLGELVAVAGELFGWDEAEALGLLSGTSPASTETGARIADLAGTAREEPAVRDALDSLLAPSRERAPSMAEIDALLGEAHAGFASAFRRYLADFGARGLRYEVAERTVGESALTILACVRAAMDTAYDPTEAEAAVARQREEARARARAALEFHSPEDRARFRQVVHLAERFYPLREENEIWTTSVAFGLSRRVALAAGRRLADRSLVQNAEDVFLLSAAEVGDLLRGDISLPEIEERRTAMATARTRTPPATYGEPPAVPDAPLPAGVAEVHQRITWLIDSIVAHEPSSRTQNSGQLVSGIPGSPGRYRGTARVVLSEADFPKIEPGDVLVCPATSPVWSFLFPMIGALVADTGGLLSHHAIIAREYGIPAVIATGNGTALFPDGVEIVVDGSAGTVTRG